MRARDKIKLTLLELLEDNPADKLAVKTLISEAGISKQTLYNNYYGILDAVCEMMCDLIDEAAGSRFGYQSWLTDIQNILIMFHERKNIMMHLWNSKWRYDILIAISDHVMPIIMNGLSECEEKTGVCVTDGEKEVMAGLYLDIFNGLLMRFMRERMTQDPEQVVKVYSAILEKDTSYGLMRLSAQSK